MKPGELPQVDRTYLLKERGIDGEIFGYHIKAEEVAVDPRASHCKAVQMLMILRCDLE